jgi:NADP-dependent 3-hydroxy acid dehydrogenase YdfG
MRLLGKTALVTGGATGIGLAIAKTLSIEGCRLAIAGRREQKLRTAAAEWPTQTPPLVRSVNVADRSSVYDLFRWANDELGQIDILINSAGVNFNRRMMADMPPETWDETIAINATGVYNCMHSVLPQMRARRDGIIVNICSVAGKRAIRFAGAAYCASKFAVTALSSFVSLEEQNNGIRVTNVCPGEVETPILEGRPVFPTAEQRSKMLQAEDVAAAVLMVVTLPPRAHIPELIIKPIVMDYA